MAETRYTPDGDRIPAHEHDWVMYNVTLHPGTDIKRPIIGATVLWRCAKRNCAAWRKHNANFRRPARNQQPNAMSPTAEYVFPTIRPIRSAIRAETSDLEG
jgi:hypothetical protein